MGWAADELRGAIGIGASSLRSASGWQVRDSVGICSQDLAGTASAVVRASRKRVVLFFGEGAVDVVGGAFVVAGGEVDLVHVDGGGVDDGGDGVVEGEVVGAGEALEFGGEGAAR